MNKLACLLVASTFTIASAGALAADPAAVVAAPVAGAKAALEKPAGVAAEAWAKMTDAEKAKAVEKAKAAAATPAPTKKEKKGGC